jgi:oligopeptide transport system substrate-binding protein
VGVGATGPLPPRRPLAAILGLLAFASACTMPPSPGDDDPPVAGPSPVVTPALTLRLAIGAPASLDPRDLDTPDALLLASQLFDGLIEYEPGTAELSPAAAESWEVLDGGQRIVFRLREGMTFHDGTPLTADAFVTAWNRLADPVAAKPFAFLLESVEGFQKYQDDLATTRLSGISAPSPLTLEVTLTRPWPDFVALLGHPALSPVPTPAPPETFATQPIGNGPYRILGPLTPGSPIRLEAFGGYYGAPPAVSSVEYRTFDAPEDAWPEFLSGELDLAEIPADVLSDATSRFGPQGVIPVARLLYCAFNEQDTRFEDPRLRTAVSLGVDRQALVDSVFARLPQAATSIVPPTIPGHAADACGDRCEHDAERARALTQGMPKRSRSFALDYAASPAGDRLAAAMVAQLAEVGLRVIPRPHVASEYENVLEEGTHEMFCLVWVADYPRQQAFLEPLLASGSVDNRAGVEDAELDAILEEARVTLDATARQRLYAEAESRALASMHVIPLIWFRAHLAVQPHVGGFFLDPLGRYDAARLTLTPTS